MCQGDTNSPGAPPIQSLSRPQISLPPLSHCGGAGAATIVARPKSARKLLDAAAKKLFEKYELQSVTGVKNR
jgi:hypothetical protein